jgi:hypothetical protein
VPAPRAERSFWGGVVAATSVLGNAVRLLWRHWPVLFAFAFLGIAGHQFALSGAEQASKIHPLAGYLVLLFAPIAVLVSYVLMLRAVRESLPSAQAIERAPATDGQARPRTLLDHLGSVLVPFILVYQSQGFLSDDISTYSYTVLRDASSQALIAMVAGQPAPESGYDRLRLDFSVLLVVIVVVAFGSRWLLGRLQRNKRRLWLGAIAAYPEIVWIMLGTVAITLATGSVQSWASSRQLVRWSTDGITTVLSRVGGVGDSVQAALNYGGGLLANGQAVILVPVAWLTVGAVVYGHRLSSTPSADELYERSGRHSRPLPVPIRWLSSRLSAAVRVRFAPLVDGLRLLFRSGLAPMLVFCLVYLALSPVKTDQRGLLGGAGGWLWELERLVIGPQEVNAVWLPASYMLSGLNSAVETVLLICLLAAAIDRVLRTRADVRSG